MTANGCGEHSRWQSGCPACQTMSRMYDRRRRSKIADGTWLHAVDATEVRAHLDTLLAAGFTVAGITQASGLAKSSILGVRKRQWVQGPTAEALFAVKPEHVRPVYPTGTVSVVGACRRVQAMAWMGWSLQYQADRADMFIQQVSQIAHAKQSYVHDATDRTFRGLFEELSATRGPSKRAHNAAVRSGWAPPLAWDDIDDLDAVPVLDGDGDPDVDMVAVARALAGERVRLTAAEQTEALRVGVARGDTLSKVAACVGLSYFKARQLLGDTALPLRAQQERVEAEVIRLGDTHPDSTIAALLGVHHQTVTRARARLARRQRIAS